MVVCGSKTPSIFPIEQCCLFVCWRTPAEALCACEGFRQAISWSLVVPYVQAKLPSSLKPPTTVLPDQINKSFEFHMKVLAYRVWVVQLENAQKSKLMPINFAATTASLVLTHAKENPS